MRRLVLVADLSLDGCLHPDGAESGAPTSTVGGGHG
jgi:hypothetical protein